MVDDDEEEYDDSSMWTFTASRLENSSGGAPLARNTKMKTENSVKVEPSEVGKDGGGVGTGTGSAPVASVPGIVVKEDSVKNIFTENLQTSGAYSAREESLKRELGQHLNSSFTYLLCLFDWTNAIMLVLERLIQWNLVLVWLEILTLSRIQNGNFTLESLSLINCKRLGVNLSI